MHLLVIADFNGHARGDVITDPAAVAAIQGGAHMHFVTPIASEPAAQEPAHAEPSAIIED